MALRNRFLLTLTLTAACTCAPLELHAQSGGERSYVMLINGNVFHGVAKPVGDRIEIQMSEGNVIQVSKQQVASIASTKFELYERQIKGSRRIGANEHWYLTQWCIQEGLLDQAIMHFEELTPLVEQNDKYKQLEHKLKTAIFNSEKVRNMLGDKHPQYTSNVASSAVSSSGFGAASATDAGVVQASANLPGSANASTSTLTDEQVRVLNSMPSYVKKSFQSHIAPLLVSRCGQAGCHGVPGADTDFHFRQAVGEQAAWVNARNLENVIRYVNPDSPAESELIAFATKAHGTQSQARFQPHVRDDDQRHIERLSQWIKSLALATPAGVTQVAVSMPPLPANQVINAVALQNPSGEVELPVSAIATSANGNSSAMAGSSPLTNPSIDGSREGNNRLEGGSRMAKIQEWREQDVEQDRDAKLSKAPKSAEGPPVLSFEELNQLEAAIERLEKKHSKQKTRDPFDPNYFNSTYGTKK